MKSGWRWWLAFTLTLFVLVATFAVPVTIWRLYGLSRHWLELMGFVLWYGCWLLAVLTAILVYESFRVGRRTAFNVCALIVACLLFFALERQANIEACDRIHGESEGSFGNTLDLMLEEMMPPEMLPSPHVAAICQVVL